jgi:hypothetical protein
MSCIGLCHPLSSSSGVSSTCCWGMGVVFLIGIRFLAHRIYLESLVQIGCVVPRLLTRLSPGDDMIPDEGIMARPMG